MPITTFLQPHELRMIDDKDIAPLLINMNNATGDYWVVLPHAFIEKLWFFRRRIVTRYSVYKHIHDNEYQIMNFFLEDTGTSINTYVPKSVILAYLYGYLGGLEFRGENPQ